MPKGKKILIVDDDARNIFALTATLKAKGYDCISTNDARTVMGILKPGHDIGVILIDMMMPEMDGYEAIHLIRIGENDQDIPIIALTAQAMKGDREKCLEAGANEYIPKPIDVDTLLNVLTRY